MDQDAASTLLASGGPAPGEEATVSRRDRLRLATVQEIKDRALAQVAEEGPQGISLRAIARAMGMTSSALYRYFDSHEQLRYELITDGFTSLAEDLEAEEAALPDDLSAAECFLRITTAYRHWAHQHVTEYGLIFGSRMLPVAGENGFKAIAGSHAQRCKEAHLRGVAVLFRVMIRGLHTGALDPSRMPAPSAALLEQLETWQQEHQIPLPAHVLGACLFAWTQLHGAISLDLFGHLPEPVHPADELFDLQMRATLYALGCSEAV
jgi:AcrR family transcriptional regulator